MQDFWSFLFSPLGLVVYAIYRVCKFYAWSWLLPRVVPLLPLRVQNLIESAQARVKRRLLSFAPVKRWVVDMTVSMMRPMKGCCVGRA